MERESLPDVFRRLDARNRENMALAGLNIRTSADIFAESQKQLEAAKAEGPSRRQGESPADLFRQVDMHNRENAAVAGLNIRTSADIFEESQRQLEQERAERAESLARRKAAETASEPTPGTDKMRKQRGEATVESQPRCLQAGRGSSRTTRPGDLFKMLDTGAAIFEAGLREGEKAVTSTASEGTTDALALADVGIRTWDGAPEDRPDAERSMPQRGVVDASVLASLGIRTSADIIEATQKEYEEARRKKGSRRGRIRKPGVAPPDWSVGGTGDAAAELVPSAGPSLAPDRKRVGPSNSEQSAPKRRRPTVRRERDGEEEMLHLASVLGALEEEFVERERLSHEQEWCVPVSSERKVKTVQDFYKAFHDTRTLPILTCMFCYRKYSRAELKEVEWQWWVASPIEKRDGCPHSCVQCFPVGKTIDGCVDCLRHLGRGVLSPAAQLHSRLGCEHIFPDELKGLTPVEEKLIALNSCYGFITKHSIVDGHRQNTRYPRHVKGHITVFPNNVQELVTKVLPHPLLKVMDEIYVSWQGREKPEPSDLAVLLSVRRRVVENALMWLKGNNPLYADININMAELDSWETPPHGVPSQIYCLLERNEPSSREKIQTAHIVPPTERGLDDPGSVDIREIMASLAEDGSHPRHAAEGDAASMETSDRGPDDSVDSVHEIGSSGMFGLDCPPDIADDEKLRYLVDSMCETVAKEEACGAAWRGSAEVRHRSSAEPYVVVSRGQDFADSFDAWFLAKAFPTLFPWGRGGPRRAEECLADAGGTFRAVDTELAAQQLVSSRNMSFEAWVKLVLQRHGGRFASHPVLAFLVFNMGVRSRNRRVSMASVGKSDFPEVERTLQGLTVSRLEVARAELESSGKTTDTGVNRLLRSLSLYGYRQPMSRESRLTMRRKIKSLIVRYGIPAIWFTLNPNDITNPIKLKLAAYRTRETGEADEFLRSLDQVYKRVRVAISDPLSSAIFFHREISMFFKHYVRIGEDSVFGRVSQYYGAVETNERGALHLHGLLWLQGNMHLSSLLSDVDGEEQAAYRDRVIQYIDSVFTEDLDAEASAGVRAGRSVTGEISSLVNNTAQFAVSFEEEANFCAGATQVHTHSPTCVKYAAGRQKRQNPCRFGAPWPLVEKTCFTEDGLLRIRRCHELVNRWNKAMAVGLRHNHDISFIMTKCKGLALVYYVTNYATKVEDPVWKRVVAAKELLRVLGDGTRRDQANDDARPTETDGRENQTRQFLLRVANRIFTERVLSQVEVVAYLQGYGTEFTGSNGWTFLNVCALYWHVYRRWPLLRRAAGGESLEGPAEEAVLLGEGGQRISLLQAYPYRGSILECLALYDYMSVVKLKHKGPGVAWGEVELDSTWPPSGSWVQVLRRPGEHATVCLDGYLSMDFTEEDDLYHQKAAVQHLGLFVPWQAFLGEMSGDMNGIWDRERAWLPKRIAWLVDNVQLLRRSAEDVAQDAKRWAALSGELEPAVDTAESASAEREDVCYRSDRVGTATRLIDVMRNALSAKEITAGSKEISAMVERMCRFQAVALGSEDDFHSTLFSEAEIRTVRNLGGTVSGVEKPGQEQLRSIKAQQTGLSREREKAIQGIQGGSPTALDSGGQDEDYAAEVDRTQSTQGEEPSTRVCFGRSTSFCEVGRQVAESLTLNRRQRIALWLICAQLDEVRRDEISTTQLCMFVGGEGGTGKSRFIAAIAEVFARTAQSNRLLVTATSGTAAANIKGITIHSACRFSKDMSPRAGRAGDNDGFTSSGSATIRIDGRTKMDWQDKYVLVIDEVSMLGVRTLYAVNEQLCRLRGSSRDFGGIPIVLFCGDFHQFRPVQERSILLPSSTIPWEGDYGFGPQQRREHDVAHTLWRKFTTVVMLNEQVRAANDPTLRRLLTRIRQGVQDQSDVELLNSTCYEEGRRIPWESGITVVTPLNRNRWNLNMEATLAFQRQWEAPLRIFVSEHKWKGGEPTEEEALMMLNHGDDSSIPVPAFFMFVPGMPVVVNQNTHQGLQLVNGATYTAIDVVPDRRSQGHRINSNTVLHFGSPAGILLESETTRDFRFVGMPPGTILLTPITTKIECQRKRPWQRHDVSRRGLPCTAAFACTDYKVQARTLDRVALELRGTRTTNIGGQMVPSICDPYSLYVQLSRCRSLGGIMLLSKARERDFVGNTVPEEMTRAEQRLDQLSEETIRAAESRWDWSGGG